MGCIGYIKIKPVKLNIGVANAALKTPGVPTDIIQILKRGL